MKVWVGGAVDSAVALALERGGHAVRGPCAGPAAIAGCDAAVYGADAELAGPGVGALLGQLAKGGVSRLVYLTGLGHDMDAPEGSLGRAGLAQAEVQAAALDWTVLRVAPLFGTTRGGVADLAGLVLRWPLVPLPVGGGPRYQPLAADDLGAVLARVLDSRLTVGGAYDVAGPEAFRLAGLIERLAWVRRRRVAVCCWPPALVRALAGPLARAGWPGAAWLAGATDLLPRDNQAEALLGRRPASFTRAATRTPSP